MLVSSAESRLPRFDLEPAERAWRGDVRRGAAAAVIDPRDNQIGRGTHLRHRRGVWGDGSSNVASIAIARTSRPFAQRRNPNKERASETRRMNGGGQVFINGFSPHEKGSITVDVRAAKVPRHCRSPSRKRAKLTRRLRYEHAAEFAQILSQHMRLRTSFASKSSKDAPTFSPSAGRGVTRFSPAAPPPATSARIP